MLETAALMTKGDLHGERGATEDAHVNASLLGFSAWVGCQISYSGLPALAVSVVLPGGGTWMRGFGSEDTETQSKADAHTLFRIGSLTKLFTCVAILKLRDGGKLDLDDPAALHSAWLRGTEAEELSKLTIRQLLRHRSGLPRDVALPYWNDGRFPSEGQLHFMLRGTEAIAAPDSRFNYSNLGFALLGKIVNEVSGMEFSDFVSKHIAAPLAMTETLVRTPTENLRRLAMGFGRLFPDGKRGSALRTDARALCAAVNMTSSVSDLSRFISIFLEAARGRENPVLGIDSVQEMLGLQGDGSRKQGSGFGFFYSERQGHRCYSHIGRVSGYSGAMEIYPEDGVGLVVLTNADDGCPNRYLAQALQWLHLGEAIPLVSADPTCMYAGKYRCSWMDLEVVGSAERLVVFDVSQAELGPAFFELALLQNHTFRVVHTHGAMPVGFGETCRFVVGRDGTASEMIVGCNAATRVALW